VAVSEWIWKAVEFSTMALQLHVRAGKYCFQEALPLFVSEAPPSHAELPLSGMLLACVALSGLPRVEVVAADAIAKPCYLAYQ